MARDSVHREVGSHNIVTRVGFKYVLVFEYQHLVYFVFELKITKGRVLVFDILSVLEKYLQIQSNTHKNCHFTNKR